ncbi:MAG: hypothetical protein K2H09_01170, partial [Treponemataceae bacterium]|nr:hypothetical protein [Treponemataceae bacterium]
MTDCAFGWNAGGGASGLARLPCGRCARKNADGGGRLLHAAQPAAGAGKASRAHARFARPLQSGVGCSSGAP